MKEQVQIKQKCISNFRQCKEMGFVKNTSIYSACRMEQLLLNVDEI